MKMRWTVLQLPRTDQATAASATLYDQLTTSQVLWMVEAGELRGRDLIRSSAGGAWQTIRQWSANNPGLDVPQRRRRQDQHDTASTDMTPMVDMTFLLLIFFMLTASFEIQASFPVFAEGASMAPTLRELSQQAVVVRLERSGEVSLLQDGESLPIKPEHLEQRLAKLARERKVATVIVDAADDAPYQRLVDIIDASYRAGLEDVRLAIPARQQRHESSRGKTRP